MPHDAKKLQREIAGEKVAVLPGTKITEDDLSNLWAMYGAMHGGGVAPVSLEDAKRLEASGMVKLHEAHEEDAVAGEIEPEYTFTLTDQGERAARAYRETWASYAK